MLIATGKLTRLTITRTELIQPNHSTSIASETTWARVALMANITTAKANHSTCWRSIPLERISRTNSDVAAVIARVYMTVSTGFMTFAATSMPRGLLRGPNRAAVSGQSATATVPPATARATSAANGRQRGEGSLPSGNRSARNMKGPKCTTHTQEETQASPSPLGNALSQESGGASNVAMAYSAVKRRMAPKRPIAQNSQPMGLRGGRRGAMIAPTGEKLTAITVFSSQ